MDIIRAKDIRPGDQIQARFKKEIVKSSIPWFGNHRLQFNHDSITIHENHLFILNPQDEENRPKEIIYAHEIKEDQYIFLETWGGDRISIRVKENRKRYSGRKKRCLIKYGETSYTNSIKLKTMDLVILDRYLTDGICRECEQKLFNGTTCLNCD